MSDTELAGLLDEAHRDEDSIHAAKQQACDALRQSIRGVSL